MSTNMSELPLKIKSEVLEDSEGLESNGRDMPSEATVDVNEGCDIPIKIEPELDLVVGEGSIKIKEEPLDWEEEELSGQRRSRRSSGEVKKESEPAFSCLLCGFRTKEVLILQEHVAGRQGDTCPIPFTYCDFSGLRRSSLSTTLLTASHRPVQHPFACQYCHYTTPHSSSLKRHIRARHTSERPYACPHCEHTSAESGNLRYHIFAHHRTERVFACPHCEYSAAQSAALKSHIREHHTTERPFACPYCEHTCAQSANLRYHIYARHSSH